MTVVYFPKKYTIHDAGLANHLECDCGPNLARVPGMAESYIINKIVRTALILYNNI